MGEFHYLTLTANEFANDIIHQGDDIVEAIEAAGQNTLHLIYGKDGKPYEVTFTIGNTKRLSVYDYVSDEQYNDPDYDGEGGYLIEGDIPYAVLKIEDGNGKIIYNVTDHI